MARGAKPGKAKGEAKRQGARAARKGSGSRVHDLEERLAEAQKREAEALEQQTATAEVLKSNQPLDVLPSTRAAKRCRERHAPVRGHARTHLQVRRRGPAISPRPMAHGRSSRDFPDANIQRLSARGFDLGKSGSHRASDDSCS